MNGSKTWPWYQQVVDAMAAALAIGIACVFTYRNTWPIPGVVFIVICLGKVGASAALRVLVGRWTDKP